MPTTIDPARLRTNIAVLLNDRRIAERVRRRLAEAGGITGAPPAAVTEPGRAASDLAGTPPCLRAASPLPFAPLRLRAGHCRAVCGGIDCLCGAFPARLTDAEITHGRRLEPVLS